MLLHTEKSFDIFFGDIKTAFNPAHWRNKNILLTEHPFKELTYFAHLNSLLFLHQTHSNQGLVVYNEEQLKIINPFSFDGDFLITDQLNIGLGIATADCLPIILYDSLNHVIGIIHAGWRGSVQKIAVAALESMIKTYSTHPEYVRVYFGPSANLCCYSVSDEVLDALNDFSFKDNVIVQRNKTWYFDVPLFNKILLQNTDIPAKSFHASYNICTIETPTLCSYRRDKQSPLRQMTVVVLK